MINHVQGNFSLTRYHALQTTSLFNPLNTSIVWGNALLIQYRKQNHHYL